MSQTVITLEDLSKRYLIGHQKEKGDGLRHAIERAARAPLRWFRPNGKVKRSRREEEFWALRDVNLQIGQGEVVGIIGRNGAGKSTLLKVLSRITEPTLGCVRIRGRVASLLEVGTGFHPELTGRENVFLNGAILGMSRHEIRRKFDEIVAFAEVEKFLDTPVKRYSSGMYVRLAFAVAAHLEPEILIVDEVLAVGDAEFQRKCLGKMEDASAREGRTVLFVSHQMPVIQNLCKHCVLLSHGRMVLEGKTTDVVNHYLSKAAELTVNNLSERRDRAGKGEGRIREVRFFNAEGEPLRKAVSGQTVVVQVSYSVRTGVTLRNCRISLAIIRNGRPYFTLSTDLVDKSPLPLSGNGHVEFVVPDWPLSGGTYHLSMFLASDGDMAQDWIDDGARLDVVDGDYYGTGRLYHRGWQGESTLVRHSYRHFQDTADADCLQAADALNRS